jgi:hypothetical protein
MDSPVIDIKLHFPQILQITGHEAKTSERGDVCVDIESRCDSQRKASYGTSAFKSEYTQRLEA